MTCYIKGCFVFVSSRSRPIHICCTFSSGPRASWARRAVATKAFAAQAALSARSSRAGSPMIAVSSSCRRRVPTIDSTPIPLPCARSTRRRSLKLAGKWKGRRLSEKRRYFTTQIG